MTRSSSANFLIWTFLFILLYLVSLHSFLLFHSIVEVFTIAATLAIAMLVWNSRFLMKNNYLLILGVGYGFIAVLDGLHALAYQGMGVFTGKGANLPTQLWMAARFLQAGTLIVAPFFFGRRLKVGHVLLGSSLFSVGNGWFRLPACCLAWPELASRTSLAPLGATRP